MRVLADGYEETTDDVATAFVVVQDRVGDDGVIEPVMSENVAVFALDVEQVNADGHDDVMYPELGVQTGVTVAP